jgi:purine-binding chemotaxis protein CheW
MSNKDGAETGSKGEILQLSCFYIGQVLCGVGIDAVQEINKNVETTKVPLAPSYVVGIMNLRGQIVTVIDLGRKLELSPVTLSDKTRVIIVEWSDEYVGFMVDSITDVYSAESDEIVPPPSNIKGAQGKYFQGVAKSGSDLVGILDIDAVFSVDAAKGGNASS